MARGDDDGDDGGDQARWLTTYGDAMTLLLVFFVLLLSMSEIDPDTVQVVISSFQGAVGVFDAGRTVTPAEMLDMGINVQELSDSDQDTEQETTEQITDLMEEVENEQVDIRQDERGIVIQVTDQLLFELGEVEVSSQGQAFLERLSMLLNNPAIRERQLRVEGHTDNTQPTGEFSSNWKVSSDRAVNVVEELQGNGIDQPRMSAVGFGQTRPIATNDTEEGRAQNRRVEIVVLRDDAN